MKNYNNLWKKYGKIEFWLTDFSLLLENDFGTNDNLMALQSDIKKIAELLKKNRRNIITAIVKDLIKEYKLGSIPILDYSEFYGLEASMGSLLEESVRELFVKKYVDFGEYIVVRHKKKEQATFI